MKLLKTLVLTGAMMAANSAAANSNDPLLRMQSARGFDETVVHLRQGLESKGMTVFTTVDHAGAAAKAGLKMPPTKVLIFGNPNVGTPLMQVHPDVALDLPLRVLVRQRGSSVEVLMHRSRDLSIPAAAQGKLAPAEELVRRLVTGP